ncbi:MAG: hypothetical protein MJ252_08780, partial [archaeon]|nr:hypothetical protein [archaeon]
SYDEPLTIAVGCKTEKEGKNEYIKLYSFDEKKKDFVSIGGINEYHTLSVTDVEFSDQLGRDYLLLASTSVDKSLNIWKIKLDYKIELLFADIKMSYQNIFHYQYNKPLWRVSWNSLGIYLAASSEDRVPIIFRKLAGDKFIKYEVESSSSS